MKFKETEIKGAFLIDPEPLEDERGFFARTWCRKEFEQYGLNVDWVQCNISYNTRRGTLRGMHYQIAPYAEAKLVRCTMGAIYDVIIDLRPDSGSYRKWISAELSAENRKMIYIPQGFAHGFQTIVDHTEVFYQMSAFYAPEYARAVRWNDPQFNIHWPEADRIISEKDQKIKDFDPGKNFESLKFF
jgi:dTDP-4-dehydrorhamnose 3,5-epimerase